jgi:lipopolysaccharide/colanic/teichoic acid biosynthesis glycosyltransferase
MNPSDSACQSYYMTEVDRSNTARICGPLHTDNPSFLLGTPHTAVPEISDATCSPSPYFRYKQIIDLCLVAVLMIAAMPVMCCIALLIAVCNGRPIFYRQLRVGKNGALFRIWKFRSMRRDAEITTGPVWSSPFDQRVTGLGYWLRVSHLDELPQLFNVIAGDMGFIGPRPERPEFVNELNRDIPGYAARHSVRPGITGLAQVSQGYDSNISDVSNKIRFDLTYIKSATLFGDAAILCRTIPVVATEIMLSAFRNIRSLPIPKGALQSPEFIAAASSPQTNPILNQQLTVEEQLHSDLEQQHQILAGLQNGKVGVPPPKLKSARLKANQQIRYAKSK